MKTNKNSVRRSLIVSATALVLTVAMLIGTTFAWFTDSVTSGRNKIQAGNLDVELEYSKDFNTWNTVTENAKLFEDSETWEPGHTDVVYLRVSNAGTLALDYTLAMNIVKEVGSTNVNDKPFKLSQYIKYGVKEFSAAYADRKAAVNDVDATATNIATGTLKAEQLLKNQTKTFALVVYMPGETTGNEANHKTSEAAPYIELGIDLRAVQSQHEEDSFGKDYDATADGNPDHKDWVTGNVKADVTVPVVEDSETKLENAAGTVSVTVPADAILAEGTSELKLSVTPASMNAGNVTINAGETAQTYNVEVNGLDASNTKPVSVKLFIGKGLQGVTAYHKADELTDATYDEESGYITFTTTSFSPFTFVYKQPAAVSDDGTFTYDLKNALYTASSDVTWTMMQDTIFTSGVAFSGQVSVVLDLNGYTLTYNNNDEYCLFVAKNGASFTIKNGSLNANAMSRNDKAVLSSSSNSTITFENIKAKTNGSLLMPEGSTAAINIYNSTIDAALYGIGTNASKGAANSVAITIKNSQITTHSSDSDNTAVYINVPGTLDIENSTITGDRQGTFVRGGDATIKNSTIKTTGLYEEDLYLDGYWRGGNEIPKGALIVGNRHNGSYQYPTTCTLVNTKLVADNNVRTLYISANNAIDQTVTFNYDEASNVGTIEYGLTPGITVNGQPVSSKATE